MEGKFWVVLVLSSRYWADVSGLVSIVRGANYSTPLPPPCVAYTSTQQLPLFSIILQIDLQSTKRFVPNMIHSVSCWPDVQISKVLVKVRFLKTRCWSGIWIWRHLWGHTVPTSRVCIEFNSFLSVWEYWPFFLLSLDFTLNRLMSSAINLLISCLKN